MSDQDKMRIWNAVCETDPKNTKQFKGKGGFTGTAACAQSQRKQATELWGPFGEDWGLREERYEILEMGEDKRDSILVYRAELFYPSGKFGVAAEIDTWAYSQKYDNWRKGNDLHKKVRTDAMTKGLSELGFNSDLFEGKYDDNKYVAEMKQKHAKPAEPDETRLAWDKIVAKFGETMTRTVFEGMGLEYNIESMRLLYAECQKQEQDTGAGAKDNG